MSHDLADLAAHGGRTAAGPWAGRRGGRGAGARGGAAVPRGQQPRPRGLHSEEAGAGGGPTGSQTAAAAAQAARSATPPALPGAAGPEVPGPATAVSRVAAAIQDALERLPELGTEDGVDDRVER